MKSIFFSAEELQQMLDGVVRKAILEETKKMSAAKTDREKRIYTANEAAEYLSISIHTVRKYKKLGLLKPIMTLVKGDRYHIDELNRFANSRRLTK